MLETPLTALFGIDHPVVLAGMGRHTSPELVAAVSNAGALGILGVSEDAPERQRAAVARIRALTDAPFGLNHTLAFTSDERFAASVELGPAVLSTSWRRGDQDPAPWFARAHDGGCRVMHMADNVDEAERAAAAGADVIVAQGSDGGGHVGTIGTMVLVPQVVRAVAPIPVVAAGGIADGGGLVGALALGAVGVLMGTRFLATSESPVPDGHKRAIVESRSEDACITEVPDIADGMVWPGATARVLRNSVVRRWLGRESEVRRRWVELGDEMRAAQARDDAEEYPMQMGQSVGLVRELQPAGAVVEAVVREAVAVLDALAGCRRAEQAPAGARS